MTSSDETLLTRELGRRRVYIFVSVFLALEGLIREEGDIFLHALDGR